MNLKNFLKIKIFEVGLTYSFGNQLATLDCLHHPILHALELKRIKDRSADSPCANLNELSINQLAIKLFKKVGMKKKSEFTQKK